ncbi:phosphate transport system regulatory protein PhoU [Tistrella bauzanensis]|uniref:Phosphate-specific transport system accessory protein PhoU n=1 Tax=Tistrella bauzanensis TaxID=657419 RepID=A0ABQ1IW85_9PROT|nr:phosphate signaling complex protein PhoU [Tistrella bauzanensis]GGB54111.1 phosphate transport system regulatory protein PhoU [Tistrella bauzanensis]
MPITGQHIVKSFDEEIARLGNDIVRMGGQVETQIDLAMRAIASRDSELASEVVAGDSKVDGLEDMIEEQVVRLFALRSPVANDLRLAFAAMRIAAELERMGDLAKNAAKRAIILNQAAPVRPVHVLPRMAAVVQRMLKDVLDAFVERDADRARAVWRNDAEVDELHNSLFRELLTYMMEDPRHITACTHMLFIAKNIERMGDHTTNIAEQVIFVVEGSKPDTLRPKTETVINRSGDAAVDD